MTVGPPVALDSGVGVAWWAGRSQSGDCAIASSPHSKRKIWSAAIIRRFGLPRNGTLAMMTRMSEAKSSSQHPVTAWPHAPAHRLSSAGTYFVTAGTYRKAHFFNDADRLGVLHRGLLRVMHEAGWTLEAWAVFPNHYHFVAHSPVDAENACDLSGILAGLHRKTALWVNQLDDAKGRKVWHNFWETKLTYEKSYLARLNYCHQNAVKHGVVRVANLYPWCSASWFERTARPAQVKTIYSLKTDELNVFDDYEVNAAGIEGS